MGESYVNRTFPEGPEFEAYVNSLLADGWTVTRTEREPGVEEMCFKEYSNLTTLQTGLNRLCKDGYGVISHTQVEDPLGMDPPKYLVEAWKTSFVWRVEAWRAGRVDF